jgi:IS5 family transposase
MSPTVLPNLLHGRETRAWGDQAYRGQKAVIRQNAPTARDFTNRRYRHRGVVDATERAKNRTKSTVRARVEHPIGVIKRVFGFVKVRYRGLAKNAHRLIVMRTSQSVYGAPASLALPGVIIMCPGHTQQSS